MLLYNTVLNTRTELKVPTLPVTGGSILVPNEERPSQTGVIKSESGLSDSFTLGNTVLRQNNNIRTINETMPAIQTLSNTLVSYGDDLQSSVKSTNVNPVKLKVLIDALKSTYQQTQGKVGTLAGNIKQLNSNRGSLPTLGSDAMGTASNRLNTVSDVLARFKSVFGQADETLQEKARPFSITGVNQFQPLPQPIGLRNSGVVYAGIPGAQPVVPGYVNPALRNFRPTYPVPQYGFVNRGNPMQQPQRIGMPQYPWGQPMQMMRQA
jgi:hypothetical protein